ncbi:hypothetical protein [Bradyrhizobium sp. LMTR 3]|uniref:hypothetical protein n=1 Tax=Bradyrhizobium sp. LMTR 3 TaxID=189873 RepID=UPI0011476259|nr:hypothetical protein [Bradyrhizobium sp. LMTR 3]
MKLIADLCSIELSNNKDLGRHLRRAGEDQGRAHPVDRGDQRISRAGHRQPGAQEGQDPFKGEPETGTYFHGQDVKIGDWVVFRPGDTRSVQINGRG